MIARFGTLAVLAVWTLILDCHAVRAEAVVEEPVEAVWKPQRVGLEVRSHNIYYSCASLAMKVRAVLETAGAHPDMKVSLSCASGDMVRTAHVEVIFASPAVSSPELIATMTSYDSTTELAARVRGVRLPKAEDVERFPAHWETISLTRRTIDLDPGDCDLVRSIHDQILPKMAVRVLKANLLCGFSVPTARPSMQIMRLVPLSPQPLASR